jgi:hypothetical protein
VDLGLLAEPPAVGLAIKDVGDLCIPKADAAVEPLSPWAADTLAAWDLLSRGGRRAVLAGRAPRAAARSSPARRSSPPAFHAMPRPR